MLRCSIINAGDQNDVLLLVTRPVQYGIGVKVNAVYMSQFQLIPYNRIGDHSWEQMLIPVSVGSIYNFNQEAHERLEAFDRWVRQRLSLSRLLHADETGINIGGKRNWLHSASNAELIFSHQMSSASSRRLRASCAMTTGSPTIQYVRPAPSVLHCGQDWL